ncbi:EF-hand domain-containing protein [Luteolibacter sp. SL250]|uniref:EF-hand domain-containing protein n=1 Tax=Luteolibacter sp. SL250 TaxID=2995170 RepID=UPI00227005C6|nr:EF-hand domain-containing protein [Luteolibacter sp. SL250]WAC19934.1 EF-hand domain-containing protein [Luteolibacter sp. SL250]
MKIKIPFLLALTLSGAAFTQAHEEGGGGGGGQRGGGPGGFMARLPVIKALDKDQNGELSAEEIAGASAALLTLDKDGDGKLSAEEIRPVMPPRGETPHQIAERTFEAFDKNKDKKITGDELPERMKAMLGRADSDKDGAVTEEELEKLIEKETPPPAPRGEGGPRPDGEAPKPGV